MHDSRPAFAFISPYHYHALSDVDQQSMAKLSEDWCIISHDTQADHFIRATLELPIIDTDETFEYGVWVSLSKKKFVFYLDNFHEEIEGTTFFGYLCSQIPGYANTLSIKTNVVCGPKGQRPIVFPQESQQEHPLVHDFLHGISSIEADKRTHLLL